MPGAKLVPAGGLDMASIPFDTLQFVKTLEAAGVPAPQAEAFSAAVRDSHAFVDVAIKRDIDDSRKEMETRFEKMAARFEEMELRLTIKLGTIVVVALGAFRRYRNSIFESFVKAKAERRQYMATRSISPPRRFLLLYPGRGQGSSQEQKR